MYKPELGLVLIILRAQLGRSSDRGIDLVLPLDNEFTLENAIRLAAAQFEHEGLSYGHGTDNALDEASWLVLHAIGLPVDQVPDYRLRLSAAQVMACNSLLKRRIEQRLPAAYLTGIAWFAGLAFLADSRALVPRSPLAEFITNEFFGLLNGQLSPRILDLCTGGGCIAIASAHYRHDAQIVATDLSTDALALAALNVQRHDMQSRVQLRQGSLFEPVDGTFNLIVSNPPYVDATDIAQMPTEFSHEPMMGLAAGDDGLDLVRIMLQQAASYLNPKGYLVVEVGNSGAALEAAFPTVEFGWLQFAQGGHGVFVLSREELVAAANHFSRND